VCPDAAIPSFVSRLNLKGSRFKVQGSGFYRSSTEYAGMELLLQDPIRLSFVAMDGIQMAGLETYGACFCSGYPDVNDSCEDHRLHTLLDTLV
jgi:hypothetical protein